jgi:Lrp/AsnC family transcriptional regulator, leucine-responsive regulatory protein
MDIKLTKADKIILKEIAFNSRILEKELARKCNLSKDSIRYRIARLERLEVLNGYGVFVDYTRLGYESYKLYLRLNATFEQRRKLRDFLGGRKEVFATFESNGNWDVALAVFAKSRQEYNVFENDLLSKFGSLIIWKDFCLMMDVKMFDYGMIHESSSKTVISLWDGVDVEKIDEKDVALIGELHKNSRMSLVNLSAAVGLSVDAVSKRLKKMEASKVIQFYSADIDYGKLGFEKYKLFVYVNDYSSEIEEQIFSFLQRQKNAINVVRTIGPWKLEIEFLIEKHEVFEGVLSEMQEKFGNVIQKLDFSIFKNEVLFPAKEMVE